MRRVSAAGMFLGLFSVVVVAVACLAGRADGQDTVGHALRLLFTTQRLALWLLFAVQRRALSLLFALRRASLGLSSIARASMYWLSGVARTSGYLLPEGLSIPLRIAPRASPPTSFWPEVLSTKAVPVTKSEQLNTSVHFWAGVLFALSLAILGMALYTRFRATDNAPAQGHPVLHPPIPEREVPAINNLPRPVPRLVPRLMSIWQDSLHTALVRHHEVEFYSLRTSWVSPLDCNPKKIIFLDDFMLVLTCDATGLILAAICMITGRLTHLRTNEDLGILVDICALRESNSFIAITAKAVHRCTMDKDGNGTPYLSQHVTNAWHHDSDFMSVAATAQGHVAIGSTDGSIRFYKSGTLLTRATTCYKGIKEPIGTMAISPDSSTVVVTTDAGTCWAVRADVTVEGVDRSAFTYFRASGQMAEPCPLTDARPWFPRSCILA